jgi:hypothetical protein
MEVANWRNINKGCLKGSFDVTIPAYGLTIHECKLFEKDGRQWVGFPSRTYTSGGEEKHFDYVRLTKERKAGFDAECLKLLAPLMQAAPATVSTASDIPF